nr:NTP transferase domain-containing protein [Aeromicrobium stalagmiti]
MVLAAGAGSRCGVPDALARTPEGAPWLEQATTALQGGGCDDVLVVLGAMAETALHLVPPGIGVVVARGGHGGGSAALLAGLQACVSSDAASVVVTLVDLPGLVTEAIRRVAADAGAVDLRRATYGDVAGHPVLVGRDHWSPLAHALTSGAGAGSYLAAHGAAAIDCTGLDGAAEVEVA